MKTSAASQSWTGETSAQRDPFRDLQARFEEIFTRPADTSVHVPEIQLSWTEDPKEYRVRATLSGVRQEDIKVGIDSRRVLIGAELRYPGDEERPRKVTISRALRLGQEIQPLRATVKCRDAMVDLRLPKR